MRSPRSTGRLDYAPIAVRRQSKHYLDHLFVRWCYVGLVHKSGGRRWVTKRISQRWIRDSHGDRRLSLWRAHSADQPWAGTQDEISHTADAIHQEPVFTASPKRVYDALTDAKLFTRVVQLSGALQA